jgi:protein-L-isoaspartate(D-aspartate) O-methyltransferase
MLSEDNYKFLRTNMVKDQIEKRGIQSSGLLDVFSNVPRHLFVRPGDVDFAYNDYPLPIGEEQTISQPYIVAQMVNSLDLKPNDKVLEIGTGSGYQTAILASMVKHVYTVERIEKLQLRAKKVLEELGYTNIEYYHKDGKVGLKEYSPFNKIIVSAAANGIPKELLEQLEVGGKMVIPVGGYYLQKLLLLEKKKNGYNEKILAYCRFVRLI